MKLINSVGFCLLLSAVIACKNNKKAEQTLTAGSATFVADETFKPIVDDELYVFHNTYDQADIKIKYNSERAVLNEFLNNDSIRVAIISRELTDKEKKVFLDKKIVVRSTRFAIDGIALIANGESADSVITVDEIMNVMQGKASTIKSLVFDNANSSTVRYLKQLSNVKDLPSSGIYALQSNEEVIKYVYNNKNAIGVVGVNWLEQPDKDLEKIISSVKILGVKNQAGKPGSDKFYGPDQTNLALGVYPLTRNIYIIDCQGRRGLGTGFASFIAGETGQRIVLKSGLLPDKIPSREIIIRESLEK